MPRKPTLDHLKIKDPFLDRRVKLLPCQKEMVKWWFNIKGRPIFNIARIFKVHPKMIRFIVFPEELERHLQKRAERGGSRVYYDKTKHAKEMKTTRRYKRKINHLLEKPCNETPEDMD